MARPTPPTLTPYVDASSGGTRAIAALNLNGDRQQLLDHSEAVADWADELAGETYRAKSTEASLRAAVAAADSNGGGKVEAHAMGYDLTQRLDIPSNVWLEGAGATVLRQANGANLPTLVASEGFETLVGTAVTDGPNRFWLTNLIIDGNYENNLTGATVGLGIYGFGFDLDLIRIRFCRRIGLWTEWGPGNDPTGSPLFDRDTATEGFITRLRINDCISGGWYFNGPNDPIMHTMMLVRNGHGGTPASPTGDPSTEPGSGWNMRLGSNAIAPVFGPLHLWGNSLWHLYMGNAQGGEFHGAQIEGGGNTSGAGGCVYYSVPGAAFHGGRIFTGASNAGWLDSARGIVFGPNAFHIMVNGTQIDYCRPAFAFTTNGGADGLGSGSGHIRARYNADTGNMISGTPGDITWDIKDGTWNTGSVNLPSTSRRVMYGTEADQTTLDA